jgi:hypothetical protein
LPLPTWGACGDREYQPPRPGIGVEFSPGRFKIDGQPITIGRERRFYFDPRLIVRGLEVVKGRQIGFAISETPVSGQSILHMTSDRDQWRVQCALLRACSQPPPPPSSASGCKPSPTGNHAIDRVG